MPAAILLDEIGLSLAPVASAVPDQPDDDRGEVLSVDLDGVRS